MTPSVAPNTPHWSAHAVEGVCAVAERSAGNGARDISTAYILPASDRQRPETSELTKPAVSEKARLLRLGWRIEASEPDGDATAADGMTRARRSASREVEASITRV